jgi:hypothetical protein
LLAINAGGNAQDYQRNLLSPGYESVLGTLSANPSVVEDGKAGTSRWYASGTVVNVVDASYGKEVLQHTGTGVDFTVPEWTHTNLTNARWSVRRTLPDAMLTGFKVTTSSGKFVYLYYNHWKTTTAPSLSGSGPYYVYHGIGVPPSANGWQTIDRDLEADLRDELPNETIAQIKQFLMFNAAGSVADIQLFPRVPE